jgi:plasmid segregation protein ParM
MAEIIFGIDHGNGNMKGNNVDFPCGLVRYTSEPGRFMNEDILEYQGTFNSILNANLAICFSRFVLVSK